MALLIECFAFVCLSWFSNLFLWVPWVGVRSVIVEFAGHTHLSQVFAICAQITLNDFRQI